jgi:hypothetical protein
MKHLSKTPLLSTYKKEAPSSSFEPHTSEEHQREREEQHHPMGLGPS